MKDQASNISGDGTGTRYSRRVTQLSPGTQQQRSVGDAGGPQFGSRKWNIPKFPDNWKSAIGASFFKLLLEWRVEAHKGRTQSQLNERFNTVIESFKTSASAGGKKKTRSRRTKKASDNTSGASNNNDSGNDDGSDPQGDDTVTRKRIRLQKSRRVITERNA